METTIILGLYRDNGKENGNYYIDCHTLVDSAVKWQPWLLFSIALGSLWKLFLLSLCLRILHQDLPLTALYIQGTLTICCYVYLDRLPDGPTSLSVQAQECWGQATLISDSQARLFLWLAAAQPRRAVLAFAVGIGF